MPNLNAPKGNRFKGWFFDQVNNRLEYWFNGTKVGHLDASGFSITDDSTARMTNGQVTSDGLGTGVVGTAAASAVIKQDIVRLGTSAAVASNGAGAILPNMGFVAPYALQIVSAWRQNISASDVTVGTSVSSASYRRLNLITNTAGTGSGTNIVASLNATASAASLATRSFTTVASTVPAGAIVLASHLTVGADTADGTDMAACIVTLAYQRV